MAERAAIDSFTDDVASQGASDVEGFDRDALSSFGPNAPASFGPNDPSGVDPNHPASFDPEAFESFDPDALESFDAPDWDAINADLLDAREDGAGEPLDDAVAGGARARARAARPTEPASAAIDGAPGVTPDHATASAAAPAAMAPRGALRPDAPEFALAQGFAAQVAVWARRAGAPDDAVAAAQHAARELSLAAADGEVFVSLEAVVAAPGWPGGPTAARARLLASRVVGVGRAGETPARLPEAGDVDSMAVDVPGTAQPTDRARTPGGEPATGHGVDPASDPTALFTPIPPLVLDDAGRLYLHRYWDLQQRLARRVAELSAQPMPFTEAQQALLRARIATLFADNRQRLPEGSTDWQRVAVALALTRGFTVVSGGPGTGKTTMVVSLLACLLEAQPDCRIALAAPTGKAAARMTEAVARGREAIAQRMAAADAAAPTPAQRSTPARTPRQPSSTRPGTTPTPPAPESFNSSAPQPAHPFTDRLALEARTVHRLLGADAQGRFRHHRANPLPVDVLVVDEASMLDLALAARLLEAVPRGARVVLLGDKDQLASVEAGAVFAGLSSDPSLTEACRAQVASLAGLAPADIVPPAAAPGPRADSTVWLTHTWRFDPASRIGQLARRIVHGDTQDLAEWLAQGERGSEVYWLRDTPDQRDAVAEAALEGYAEYLRCIRQGERDPRRLREVFDRFRVLCAVRDGRTGTRALNRLIAAQVAAAAHAAGEGGASAWTTGRAVMV
ncbi:MAG: AAA family ATPase, partial [Pseudomonadota bacterium]